MNGFYSRLIHTHAEEKKRKETERKQTQANLKNLNIIIPEEIENAHEDEEDDIEDHRINEEISNPIYSHHIIPQNNSKFHLNLDLSGNAIVPEHINLDIVPVAIEEKYKTPNRKKSSMTPKTVVRGFQKLETGPIKNNEIKKKEIEKQEAAFYNESRKRLLSMLKDHKKFIVGAAVSAAVNGALWPIYGILLGDACASLSLKLPEDVAVQGRNVAILFTVLATCAGIALWMQKYINIKLVTSFMELEKFLQKNSEN